MSGSSVPAAAVGRELCSHRTECPVCRLLGSTACVQATQTSWERKYVKNQACKNTGYHILWKRLPLLHCWFSWEDEYEDFLIGHLILPCSAKIKRQNASSRGKEVSSAAPSSCSVILCPLSLWLPWLLWVSIELLWDNPDPFQLVRVSCTWAFIPLPSFLMHFSTAEVQFSRRISPSSWLSHQAVISSHCVATWIISSHAKPYVDAFCCVETSESGFSNQ